MSFCKLSALTLAFLESKMRMISHSTKFRDRTQLLICTSVKIERSIGARPTIFARHRRNFKQYEVVMNYICGNSTNVSLTYIEWWVSIRLSRERDT